MPETENFKNTSSKHSFAKQFWSSADELDSVYLTERLKSFSPQRLISVLGYQGLEKNRNIHKIPLPLIDMWSMKYHLDENLEQIIELGHPWESSDRVDGNLLSERYMRDMEVLRSERQILETSFNNEVKALRDERSSIENKLNEARLTHSKQLKDIASLKKSVEDYADKTKQLEQENKELKQHQLQMKINKEVPVFVDKAKRDLAINEKHFRLLARRWNRRGTFAVGGAAILSSIFVIYTSVLMLFSPTEFSWALYGTMLFKEMLVVSILAAFAKYSFAVGSAYTHESVKRTDRIHAIGFGKMYLEIYGSQVDQQDVKSIFENWNLNSDSSFTKIKEADFENKTYNKLADAIIALTKQENKKSPEQSPTSHKNIKP